jgi:glutamate synthase (NADPH/NADH) large chain
LDPLWPSLDDRRFEHDACGTGFVARASGAAGHDVLRLAVTALARLEHRGAMAADGKSGDGAGVLTQIPRALLADALPGRGDAPWGVGMLFLPPGGDAAQAALARALDTHGLALAGWRTPPLDPSALGAEARATQPLIRQALVTPRETLDAEEFERRLYRARKAFERAEPAAYVCSLSGRHVVYKALCAPHQLPAFYRDLADPGYETAFALYHSRFSTNTLPSWEMAQPFRLLAHNGEINTLWGNRAWMRSREHELPAELRPVLPEAGSDSANLDAALELLARTGRDVVHGLSMLIVPAWEERAASLPPEVVAFHRYHASLMEPWDGPAALVFADGPYVGAALDRNGLRPCRYTITRDGLVVAGSEVGVVDLDPDEVIDRGRLGPGQVLVVDLEEGRVIHDADLKRRLAAQHPYREWVRVRPWGRELEGATAAGTPPAELARLQRAYGHSKESLTMVLAPMAERGAGATWSMGDDIPIPPLGTVERSLYPFFRQRFAQVTNPPIDHLREALVMTLRSWIGPRPPLLRDGEQRTALELPIPVLARSELRVLESGVVFPAAPVACVFPPRRDALRTALDEICAKAAELAAAGTQLLVLTDRPIGPDAAPIPMPLAVGAVHHHLVRTGQRTQVGLIVECGDAVDVHDVAVLIGFGASAVCPWVALRTALDLAGPVGADRTVEALAEGLRKVMSKMGISTITSYRGAQLFDILGLGNEVVARCFPGVASPIGGLGFAEIADAVLGRHRAVFTDGGAVELPDLGLVRYRRDGEQRAWAPDTVRALQRAVGSARRATATGTDDAAWTAFAQAARTAAPVTLRDLLAIDPAGPPVPLDDVEPTDAIVRRFVTSAMSFGALSPEAHRTLAIAMNRLGARSNTGEGGEDPESYRSLADGDVAANKIKQVASGRFGVTAEYLARAEEIEIKIAQGSKPGEGGQLPGHKVTELIARLRHATPGVPLISPPPHHDIYSIEDLAQLIHDLKRCNPTALVGVKLVAEAGVGTVAAGVVKAYADYVVISGHVGGTGASPLSSIKHAGSPWELGLAEVQQVLRRNGLRTRVRLRVDGGLRTADDVLFGALFGADEFGFGTAPLVAMGCDMARQCHLNTCPTGIATQREDLRAKFRGTPGQVVRFFTQLADDVRRRLAGLGVRSLDDLIGRVDLVRQVRSDAGLDLSPMLAYREGGDRRAAARRNDRPQPEPPLDEGLAVEAVAALERGDAYRATRTIHNRDRSVGARIAGALAARWGSTPLPAPVELHFSGSAGQSFGAFAREGMQLVLDGQANDYVGKGLSGGELVLRPAGGSRHAPDRHVILGNVALYGATAGRLFAAGRAGERFAVRNSGATAVVEGAGDHACEYMTGGCVVVLGEVGVNLGAGMTGGVVYVLGELEAVREQVNADHVLCTRPLDDDWAGARSLIAEHARLTGSATAWATLSAWDTCRERLHKIVPTRPEAGAVHSRASARSA